MFSEGLDSDNCQFCQSRIGQSWFERGARLNSQNVQPRLEFEP
jgi:hypothetical protein